MLLHMAGFKNVVSKSLAIIFFGFLLPMSVLVAVKNGVFRIKNVEITTSGEQAHAFEDYVERLRKKLKHFEEVNIWEADLDKVSAVIRQEPWVGHSRVVRRFPHTLRVEITTRTPVALVLTKGEMKPLSIEGTLLPPIVVTKAPKLPVIQDIRMNRDAQLRTRVVNILKEIPATGRLSRESISGVEISRSGEIWLEHLSLKTSIKMGDENVTLKSARVARVLEYLEHNNLNGRVIDADFSKKVLVKLRNDR